MKNIVLFYFLIIVLNFNYIQVFAQEKDPILEAARATKRENERILLFGTTEEKYKLALQRADNLSFKKDFVEAIKMYSIAIEQKPEKTRLYFLRAICKYEMKDFRGSIGDCTTGLSVPSTDKLTRILLFKIRAESKHSLKDYTGAIKDYDKMVELNPEYGISYIGRGTSKFKSNQFSGAISDFDIAIELNPADPVPYLNKGYVLINIKQIDNGCKLFSKAGELGHSEAYEYIRKYCQ